jgi:hypothetical protein
MADFTLINDGAGASVQLLRPITDDAKAWVDDHIGRDNGFQPYWPTVVIETRYVLDIVHGIQADGLVVEVA